jgi:hypothetical protein
LSQYDAPLASVLKLLASEIGPTIVVLAGST